MAMKLKRSSAFYIDLGTVNTLVYERGHGFVINEPSVVAFRQRSSVSHLMASGLAAKKMIGKNPENIAVLRPLREGVVADFNSTAQMLSHFFARIKENRFFFRPRIVISLPCKVSEFEAEAVKALGKDLGAGSVHLIDEPVAAAVGAGLRILDRKASVIVDIGGGTSEVAVLSCGGIVHAEAIRVGGDEIDRAIVDYIRSHMNFLIGEQTAELLKMHVGSAFPDIRSSMEFIEVGGLDLEKGLPARRKITRGFLYPAVNSVVRQIIQSVHAALQTLEPEVASDLVDSGVVLAGGGALLHGMSRRFEHEFGLKTSVARNPMDSVAMGGARALEDLSILERIAK